jgi:hypothetical protein
MTKVETERNNCIFALLLAQKGAVADVVTEEMNKSLAALISASHAEGVAEERERILASGRRIDRDECTDGFAECDEFVCPYSLLAPKESEK